MATKFSSLLQTITKQESAAKSSPDSEIGGRVDLSVAAQGAMSELQRRKSKWVMVQAFRPGGVSILKLDYSTLLMHHRLGLPKMKQRNPLACVQTRQSLNLVPQSKQPSQSMSFQG
jgi:hypothetical protein